MDAASVLLYLGFLYQAFENPLADISNSLAASTTPSGTPSAGSQTPPTVHYTPSRGHMSMQLPQTTHSGSPQVSRTSGRPLANLSAAQLAAELLADSEDDIRQLELTQSAQSPTQLQQREAVARPQSPSVSALLDPTHTPQPIMSSTSGSLITSRAPRGPQNTRLAELRASPAAPAQNRQRHTVQFSDSPVGSSSSSPVFARSADFESSGSGIGSPASDEDMARRVLNRMSLPNRADQTQPLEQQIEDTREILLAQPRNVFMLTRLGQLLRQAKQPMSALEALNGAVTIDSLNLPTRLELARVYYDLARYNDAVRELELSRALDPINVEVQLLHGHCAFKTGNLTQSLEHYQRTLSLAGPSADIQMLLSLSRALIALGRQGEALPHLVRAIKLEPTKHAYTLLGSALQALGKPEKVGPPLAGTSFTFLHALYFYS